MRYRAFLLGSALLALLLWHGPAQAQGTQAERLAAAKEMMQIAGVAKQFDQMMPLLVQHLAQAFVALAPDKQDDIHDVLEKLAVKFVDRKGELIEQVAGLYAEALSLEDINVIIAFYRSPTGVKFTAIQPQMVRQSMQLGQRWGAELGREIEAEARRELKKRGIEL